MRKVSSIIMMLMLSIVLMGCGATQVGDGDLIKNVATLEKSEYQLKQLDISYGEYEDKVKDIVTEDYLESLSQEMLGFINNEEIRISNLKELSEDELNSLREETDKIKEELEIGEYSGTVELSKVFNAGTKDWRYVFTKVTEDVEDEDNTTVITTKRYTFEYVDDTWKIINVDSSSIWYSDEETKNELLPNLKYQTFNNEEIEYGVSYDLSEEK